MKLGGAGSDVLQRTSKSSLYTALSAILACAFCGCDRPTGDDWTPKANQNEYRFSNSKFPEYKLVVYYVRGFDASMEAGYFHNSLSKIRSDSNEAYKARALSESKFLLLQVKDIAAHTSKEDFATSFRAARVFDLKDVLDSKSDVDELIRRTVPEEPPLEADAPQYPRSGAGGLLIRRHIEKRRQQGEQPIVIPDN
jgi:hypothetical protein